MVACAKAAATALAFERAKEPTSDTQRAQDADRDARYLPRCETRRASTATAGFDE